MATIDPMSQLLGALKTSVDSLKDEVGELRSEVRALRDTDQQRQGMVKLGRVLHGAIGAITGTLAAILTNVATGRTPIH